jgi:hypothetical protein
MAITTRVPAAQGSGRGVLAEDLRRGMVAGLAAGVAMALVLLAAGERSIRRAIALEAAAPSDAHSDAVFSRPVQVAGGVLAAVLYGVFVGAIFGVVYAANRWRSSDRFRSAVWLGAVGFLAAVLVPAVKYPANPPGVGDPDTVRARTLAYVALLAASLLLTVLAARTADGLRRRGMSDETRLVLVGGGYALVVVVMWVAWPANPDPVEVPATLLWRFRLTALGGALALWAVLAATFGWAAARSGVDREPLHGQPNEWKQ